MRISDLNRIAGNTVDITHSLAGGDGDPHLDGVRYILHTPHDGDTRFDFKDESTVRLMEQDPDMHDLLEVDRDIGSGPISDQIIRTVPGGLDIRERFPRGFLDPLRVWRIAMPIAMPEVMDPDIEASVRARLKTLYDEAIGCAQQVIKNVRPRTVWIEVHTMSPNSRQRSVKPRIGELRDYIASWQEVVDSGEGRREVDVLTAMEDTHVTLAYDQLVNGVRYALAQRQIDYRLNDPYGFADDILDEMYVGRSGLRGVGVDIPKDYVAKPAVYNNSFYLADLAVDEAGVRQMADVFCEAINRVL